MINTREVDTDLILNIFLNKYVHLPMNNQLNNQIPPAIIERTVINS